jgi:hypothetical protein
MKENTKARNRWLNIRVNEDEYKKIDGYSKATTCHTVSEYSRLVLLKKPVTIKYRNQSADEFLAEMIRLKNELHAIGNNYNQAVHKLHTLDRVPEIKTWLFSNEITRHAFLNKIDEITREVNKIYLIWSQK